MAPPRKRRPKEMTAERLRNIAVWYCQRYLVSAAKLSGHLEKRLWREVPDSETRTTLAAEIPAIVSSLSEMGLVNDREAASARLRSALRSGYASDAAVTVAARGAMVDRETVRDELEVALTEALPEMETEDADPAELALEQASTALKRARRGPWRGSGQDDATRRRDAGWLQRRGFRLDTIRAALDIDPLEE
jgi:SOS response regulatory protein OraA/RecX